MRGTFAPTTIMAADAPPLSPQVFQILLTLVDEPLHGYAIIQDIATRTDGEVELTASTLYAALKRMLDAGWIDELSQSPPGEKDDSRRRYYKLSRTGLTAARNEAARLERLSAMAREKKLLPGFRATNAGKSS